MNLSIVVADAFNHSIYFIDFGNLICEVCRLKETRIRAKKNFLGKNDNFIYSKSNLVAVSISFFHTATFMHSSQFKMRQLLSIRKGDVFIITILVIISLHVSKPYKFTNVHFKNNVSL